MISVMFRLCSIVFLCLLSPLVSLAAQPADVTVTRQPPTIVRRTFDPSNPPKDMPPLLDNEAAVTHTVFGIQTELTYEPVQQPRKGDTVVVSIKIDSIAIKTTLQTIIFLPPNAPAALRSHEEGHRRISDSFYTDTATIARGVAQPYVGKTVTAEGKDLAAAKQAAVDRVMGEINNAYMQQTRTPTERVNDLFDQITDHGRKQISVDEAIKQAMEQYKGQKA